jgi:chromosome segregation ATPase
MEDKTIKLRAYSGAAKSEVAQSNLTEEQNKLLEAAKKDAQLAEEKSRSLEHLKTIEQLRESLRQEQARTAGMEARIKDLTASETSGLAIKNAQLEEEKSRSLENLKTIAQLRETLKQEQARMAELEARVKVLAASESNELAGKNAQLKEEKAKSLEYMKIVEQLRESLKQEQARTADMAARTASQEAKLKELAALEAKVKEMTDALGRISGIAAASRAGK